MTDQRYPQFHFPGSACISDIGHKNIFGFRSSSLRVTSLEIWGNPDERVGEPSLGRLGETQANVWTNQVWEIWGNPDEHVGEPSLGKLGETRANVWLNQVWETWGNPGERVGEPSL